LVRNPLGGRGPKAPWGREHHEIYPIKERVAVTKYLTCADVQRGEGDWRQGLRAIQACTWVSRHTEHDDAAGRGEVEPDDVGGFPGELGTLAQGHSILYQSAPFDAVRWN
jgi:hypothetical protein